MDAGKPPELTALQHGRLWACRIVALGWTVSGDGLCSKVQFLSSTQTLPCRSILGSILYHSIIPYPKNHKRPKKELHWSPWVNPKPLVSGLGLRRI